MNRTKGKVKLFNKEKGYGFAEVTGHQDVFVHQRHVRSDDGTTLVIGDRITFDVDLTDRGYQALNVDIVERYDSANAPVLLPGGDIEGGGPEYQQSIGTKESAGVFVPAKPIGAAIVLAEFFDEHEIEQLTDYLIVNGGANF